MKLQLYITIRYNGFKQIVDLNRQENVNRHVTDVTEALSQITYDPEEKNIFYLLKSTDQGTFIIIIRTIPTQPLDHLASWIFIPSNVNISDNSVEEVVSTVLGVISQSKISSEEMAVLRKLFDLDYDTESIFGATVENYGVQYAHRFYGAETGNTLSEYIGKKRYQTSYLQYQGVLLVDKSIASKVTGPNITDEPVNQMVKLFPPKLTGHDYNPMIFGHPFDKPFLVPLMDTVEIVWKSDTSVDVHQSLMIRQPNMRAEQISSVNAKPEPETQPADEEKTEFESPAENNHPEKEIPPVAEPIKPSIQVYSAVHEPEPTPVKAVVEPTKETEKDDTESRQSAQRTYRFEVPAKSANISGMIRFDVHTRAVLTESPIDGYVADAQILDGSRINYLRFEGSDSQNKKYIWAAIGFAIGLLVALLGTCAFSGTSTSDPAVDTDSTSVVLDIPDVASVTSPEVKAVSDQQAATARQAAKDISLAAALAYLDTNERWTKQELDSYPDLDGLYEDMNNFNHKRLYGYWATKLKDSRRFAKIAEHSKLGQRKKPRDGKKTFNTGSDQTISVRTYLNTIDP